VLSCIVDCSGTSTVKTGTVTTQFPGSGFSIVIAVAIQPSDGKIVAAGATGRLTTLNFALARYQSKWGSQNSSPL
jgi:hypothetical protein